MDSQRVVVLAGQQVYYDEALGSPYLRFNYDTEVELARTLASAYQIFLPDGTLGYIAKSSGQMVGTPAAPASVSSTASQSTPPAIQQSVPVGYAPSDHHAGARAIAGWLGAFGWIILVGGLVGGLLTGVTMAGVCHSTTNVFGQSQSQCSGWDTLAVITGGSIAAYSLIPAVMFFAGRHIVLLLAEIAEKE